MSAQPSFAAQMAAGAPVRQIDVNEAGRVLATLDDWRSLLFAMLVSNGALVLLVVGLVAVIVWMAGKRSANDQATLQALTDNTKALGDMSASVRALELIASRREAEQR